MLMFLMWILSSVDSLTFEVNTDYLSVLMINHDVVWFDISVHNTHTVTEIQSLETYKTRDHIKTSKALQESQRFTGTIIQNNK